MLVVTIPSIAFDASVLCILAISTSFSNSSGRCALPDGLRHVPLLHRIFPPPGRPARTPRLPRNEPRTDSLHGDDHRRDNPVHLSVPQTEAPGSGRNGGKARVREESEEIKVLIIWSKDF